MLRNVSFMVGTPLPGIRVQHQARIEKRMKKKIFLLVDRPSIGHRTTTSRVSWCEPRPLDLLTDWKQTLETQCRSTWAKICSESLSPAHLISCLVPSSLGKRRPFLTNKKKYKVLLTNNKKIRSRKRNVIIPFIFEETLFCLVICKEDNWFSWRDGWLKVTTF